MSGVCLGSRYDMSVKEALPFSLSIFISSSNAKKTTWVCEAAAVVLESCRAYRATERGVRGSKCISVHICPPAWRVFELHCMHVHPNLLGSV